MKTPLRNKYFWIALVIIFVAGLYVFKFSHQTQETNIGTVTRGNLVQRVTIAGNVSPNRKTVISAPYNGYVKKVYVEIGQQVQAGEPIVSVTQSLRGGGDEVYPLRAPFPGTVVQILKEEGEYVEQGSQANALVRIDDLKHFFIEATVPEIEVGRLKVEQEVLIQASAIPGRSYKGKIRNISLASKDQKDWDKSRVEFPLLIEILDSDAQLKSGVCRVRSE